MCRPRRPRVATWSYCPFYLPAVQLLCCFPAFFSLASPGRSHSRWHHRSLEFLFSAKERLRQERIGKDQEISSESYLLGFSSLNPRIDGQTPVCSSKLGSAHHLFEGGKREPGHRLRQCHRLTICFFITDMKNIVRRAGLSTWAHRRSPACLSCTGGQPASCCKGASAGWGIATSG